MLRKLVETCLLLLICASYCVAQQDEERAALIKTVNDFQLLLEQSNDDIEEIAGRLFDDDQLESLFKELQAVRKLIQGNEASDITVKDGRKGQFIYEFPENKITINFLISETQPFRIEDVDVVEEGSANDGPPKLTWETLEKAVEQAAEDGFEGALLVTRDGKVVLEKAYGFANREKQIKNSIDTVFAIGSCPIDFTHAAILLLKDQGKLELDDSIVKFFDDVPDDKKSITIDYLMTGQSGFPDFHDLPSDENADHSWIDRDEAVRRIFNQELLFKPGTDRRHSHSAWGLLAAIVEIASGQTYQEFTTKNLFEPAGMKDTGFFGDPVPEERIAVGYGYRKSSEPNSPPHWGKTSWLVMGSGGQVSTLGDILKWEKAVRSGKLLSEESTQAYLSRGSGLASDGDMFGFEFIHSHDPKSMFLLISNTISSREKRKQFDQLGRQIYELIRQVPPTKYVLGISMAYDSEFGVSVRQVIAGGAAEKAGLKEGDILHLVNGEELGDPRIDLLPLLNDPKPVDFEVIRDGEHMNIQVTPMPRK